jgi:hypothetical protein
MYLNAFGQPIIVIHSLKAASELLDRRANIYSDRPRYVVAQDLFCGGLLPALLSTGDRLVRPFLLKTIIFIVLLVVCVAIAVPHVKYSQR